jgi:hypothetical protein
MHEKFQDQSLKYLVQMEKFSVQKTSFLAWSLNYKELC